MNKSVLVSIPDTLSKETVCFMCTDLCSVDAVSSPGLRNLLQTCVDLGVKYGQFEVKDSLLGTTGLGQRIKTMATECRRKLAVELKGLLGNIGASLSLQASEIRPTKPRKNSTPITRNLVVWAFSLAVLRRCFARV